MTAWDELVALLATDPRDPGCGETLELIHRYAEILVTGADPEVAMPGVAAHLAACPPCAEDYVGLLEALRREVTESAP